MVRANKETPIIAQHSPPTIAPRGVKAKSGLVAKTKPTGMGRRRIRPTILADEPFSNRLLVNRTPPVMSAKRPNKIPTRAIMVVIRNALLKFDSKAAVLRQHQH
jgi:hypothetical protein